MTDGDDLRLALFRGASAELITLDELLELAPEARADLEVSPSWSAVSLIVSGEERWGPRLSLGALGVLVGQLPQAVERLAQDRLAVVRSGIFDVPDALFLLFWPEGHETVRVSLGMTDDIEVSAWVADGPAADRLYSWVEDHLDELDAAAGDEVPPYFLQTELVLRALRREALLGRKAVDLLGPGSS